MFEVLKLGHITLIHFKIENLFRNLCAHLKLWPKKRCGFCCLTELIFKVCQIGDGDSRNSLIALTHIRNTLHNNGIHRHQSFELQVGKFQYRFVENDVVNCASWEAIMNLLCFNVAALQEILLSDKIAKIEELIVDQFASQFEQLDLKT